MARAKSNKWFIFAITYFSLLLFQAKDTDSDPLISIGNGASVANDGGVPVVWNSNKDLQA